MLFIWGASSLNGCLTMLMVVVMAIASLENGQQFSGGMHSMLALLILHHFLFLSAFVFSPASLCFTQRRSLGTQLTPRF
jgi:hypothetical protein